MSGFILSTWVGRGEILGDVTHATPERRQSPREVMKANACEVVFETTWGLPLPQLHSSS